jgi:hypothetical protein
MQTLGAKEYFKGLLCKGVGQNQNYSFRTLYEESDKERQKERRKSEILEA